MVLLSCLSFFFFFNDTATTEIYTLSLHDALPIFCLVPLRNIPLFDGFIPSKMFEIMAMGKPIVGSVRGDRKSTRLNSSHDQISYAVFCLKKKNKNSPCSKPPSHAQSELTVVPPYT